MSSQAFVELVLFPASSFWHIIMTVELLNVENVQTLIVALLEDFVMAS